MSQNTSGPYRAPELWIVVRVDDHDCPPCTQTCYVHDERGRDDHQRSEPDATTAVRSKSGPLNSRETGRQRRSPTPEHFCESTDAATVRCLHVRLHGARIRHSCDCTAPSLNPGAFGAITVGSVHPRARGERPPSNRLPNQCGRLTPACGELCGSSRHRFVVEPARPRARGSCPASAPPGSRRYLGWVWLCPRGCGGGCQAMCCA